MNSITFRAAGVTHADGYPETLHRLQEPAAQAHAAGEPLVAILRRDPANAADPAAIEVHVPALGSSRVGFVPARFASKLAPLMDEGGRLRAAVIGVAIDEDHPERPGLQIAVALAPLGAAA